MHDLKKLLGDALYAQVTEALKGKLEGGKDAELGVINDGSYVPKTKFDDVNEKKTAAETLAKETKKALDALKETGDPVKLKADLEAAQLAVKTATEDHKKAMTDKDLDYAAREHFADAHDPALVAGMLDRTKLIVGTDGKVSGLEEQGKALREGKAFLFKPKDAGTNTNISGTKPGGVEDKGAGGAAGTVYTRAQIEAMTPDQINTNWADVSASMAKF